MIGVLLALAGGAWIATDLRMAQMDAGPGTDPGAFGFFISTWVVMMAAMMLPAITPMVATFREMRPGGQAGRAAGTTTFFVAAYLAVWTAAGLIGYAILTAGRSLAGGVFAWHQGGRGTVVAVLVLAAAYQLTPGKRDCLSRCRASRTFLRERWRDGRDGALLMGIKHGVWCVGCCWGLMAVLFALGAMSVAWMVLIAVLIAAERLLPWRRAATISAAAALATLAVGVAVAPAQVPALTVPGSAAAMRPTGMSPGMVGMSQPAGAGTVATSH